MKIVFIADFFLEQILGGGELNNEEFITIAKTKGFEVLKFQSHKVTVDLINAHSDSKFIVSNFINLDKDCRKSLQSLSYVIYEHDHKYLRTRNPQDYPGFKAPDSEIVNYEFYKNAKAVLCQSDFHSSIVRKNLNLNNILNLSGNLWTLESLKFLKSMLRILKSRK